MIVSIPNSKRKKQDYCTTIMSILCRIEESESSRDSTNSSGSAKGDSSRCKYHGKGGSETEDGCIRNSITKHTITTTSTTTTLAASSPSPSSSSASS